MTSQLTYDGDVTLGGDAAGVVLGDAVVLALVLGVDAADLESRRAAAVGVVARLEELRLLDLALADKPRDRRRRRAC